MYEETLIQFHGGLETIGGNIISLTNDRYRIITDFGAVPGVDVETLGREQRTETLYNDRQLPQLEGIYRWEEGSQLNDKIAYDNRKLETIVLISHLHLDHVGSLAHLHEDVKVYASYDAVIFYENLKGNGFLPDYSVAWQPVNEGEQLEFGPFNIRFHPTDHDTVGSSAIFIEAPDVKIVYSGDLRFTGFQPGRVMQMAHEANLFQPDLLLLEGTSFSFTADRQLTEEELVTESMMERLNLPTELAFIKKVNEMATTYRGLIAMNGYPQNLSRFLNLASMLMNYHERYTVVHSDYYHLIKATIGEEPIRMGICQLVEEADVHLSEAETKQVCWKEILEQPHKFMIQVDEKTYSELLQVNDGILLHSNGVPLGSFMTGYSSYIRTLFEGGWRILEAGVSGHATQADLLNLAYTILPEIVIPWHTFQPTLFAQGLRDYGLDVFLPEYGKKYVLSDTLVELVE